MKTIFNKQKRSVAGVLIALTALTTALTGCQEDFELDLPLAVSARQLSLTKDAGSTPVLVYSNGHWTAPFTRPLPWDPPHHLPRATIYSTAHPSTSVPTPHNTTPQHHTIHILN